MATSRQLAALVWWLVACALVSAPRSADAFTDNSAHVEIGLGYSIVHVLPARSTPSATMAVGLGLPSRFGRVKLECAATLGEGTGVSDSPQGPYPGHRTLVTFLVGLEVAEPARARGAFASAGAGIGYATVRGATYGPDQYMYGPWQIEDRESVGFAFGASTGWRSGGRTDGLGFQVAIRYHGLLYAGDLTDSGVALTLGLAR
jgi:hypothetical protein